jgi:hypothetical protein
MPAGKLAENIKNVKTNNQKSNAHLLASMPAGDLAGNKM